MEATLVEGPTVPFAPGLSPALVLEGSSHRAPDNSGQTQDVCSLLGFQSQLPYEPCDPAPFLHGSICVLTCEVGRKKSSAGPQSK